MTCLPRFSAMYTTSRGCQKAATTLRKGYQKAANCSILGKSCSHTHSDIGREVRELGVNAENRSRGGKSYIEHQVSIGKPPMACSVLGFMRFLWWALVVVVGRLAEICTSVGGVCEACMPKELL